MVGGSALESVDEGGNCSENLTGQVCPSSHPLPPVEQSSEKLVGPASPGNSVQELGLGVETSSENLTGLVSSSS